MSGQYNLESLPQKDQQQIKPSLAESVSAVAAMAAAGTLEAALDTLPATQGAASTHMTDAIRRPAPDDWQVISPEAPGRNPGPRVTPSAKLRAAPPPASSTGGSAGFVRLEEVVQGLPQDEALATHEGQFNVEDVQVPLPDGIESVVSWGQTECRLPKVAHLSKTYVQIIQSQTATEVSYARWVLAHCKPGSRYGDDFKDFHTYMKRAAVYFHKRSSVSSSRTFTRTVRESAPGEPVPYVLAESTRSGNASRQP